VGPAELVKALEFEPEHAMQLHGQWQDARIAGQRAELLREGIAAAQQLRARGWSFDSFQAALDQADEIAQLFDGEGYERDDAMALLGAAREQGMPLQVALEAFRRLPTLREIEVRTRLAEHAALEAEQRALVARGELRGLQAEMAALWPHARCLRICAALAAVITGNGSATELQAALAPEAGEMLAHVPSEDEAEARVALARWAATALSDLLVTRKEHMAELERVSRQSHWNAMAAGFVMARG